MWKIDSKILQGFYDWCRILLKEFDTATFCINRKLKYKIMLENKGKEDIVTFLKGKGHTADESETIYSQIAEYFKTQIMEGNSVQFKGVFKLRAKKLPPRVFNDNLNHKKIQFGERIKHLFKSLIDEGTDKPDVTK